MTKDNEDDKPTWTPKTRPYGFGDPGPSSPAGAAHSQSATRKSINTARTSKRTAYIVAGLVALVPMGLLFALVGLQGSAPDAASGSGADGTGSPVVAIFSIVALVVGLVLYFLPTAVGAMRSHRQVAAITMLNLCLGWTVLGWVVALVWAWTESQPARAAAPAKPAVPASAAKEIEEFSRLRDSGVITSDEFEAKKRQLLGMAAPTSPAA